MSDADQASYGQTWAAIYDDVHAFMDPAPAVTTLRELARGLRALELGTGTGRVAIPLAAAGVDVHGIEISEAMIARMRAKPGGAAIPVTQGDFTTAAPGGEFGLVYVVFSTLLGLPTQAAQVACFRNVASQLADGGLFVVEAFVPDPTRFDRQQRVQVNRVEGERAELIVSKHDPVEQRVISQHWSMSPAGMKVYPVDVRYAWPAELDLMAQLAGLRLRERWGNWRRDRFTADSKLHVSLYELS